MAPTLTEEDVFSTLGNMKITDTALKKGLIAKNKAGPNRTGEYLTQDQIKKYIDEIDEAMNNIAYSDDPYWARASNEQKKIALDGLAKQSEEFQRYLDPENFPDGVTPPPAEDFEIIPATSKRGKEISEKLGITAKPGYPVTETGKPDLKVVGGKDTKVLAGSNDYKQKAVKRDRPNIRLMKNFEKELTDIDLAQEGYNLQEIDIIRKARTVMKNEGLNPDDSLAWVRREMADEAGVDIEEFMTDFDWGDVKEDLAQGGLVGLKNKMIREKDLL